METYCVLILRSTVRVVRRVHTYKALAVDPGWSTGIARQSACFAGSEYLVSVSAGDGAGVLLSGLTTVGVDGVSYLNVFWAYDLVSGVDVFPGVGGVVEGDFCPVFAACVGEVAVESADLFVGLEVEHGVARLAAVSCGVGGAVLYIAYGAGHPFLVAYSVALVDGACPSGGGGEGDSGCCCGCCGEDILHVGFCLSS